LSFSTSNPKAPASRARANQRPRCKTRASTAKARVFIPQPRRQVHAPSATRSELWLPHLCRSLPRAHAPFAHRPKLGGLGDGWAWRLTVRNTLAVHDSANSARLFRRGAIDRVGLDRATAAATVGGNRAVRIGLARQLFLVGHPSWCPVRASREQNEDEKKN
jgi:hypothetical protein